MTIRVRTLALVLALVLGAGVGGFILARSGDEGEPQDPDPECLAAARELADQASESNGPNDTTGYFENSQGSIVTYDLREVFGEDAGGGLNDLRDRDRARAAAEALC